MGFLATILDVIFPSKCLSCGESGVEFCVKCLAESPAAERESAKWIYPLFDYRHPPIKKAVWLLKYKGRKRLAGIFAEAMYDRILEEMSELLVLENFREPIMIPVPLSKKRFRERGFNQAEIICKKLLELDRENKILCIEKEVLQKITDTEHQARIENRSARLKNVIGSFGVKNGERIKGRNIILIDDVTTTGATLAEAKKILKSFGAKKVVAFTLAH